MDKITKDESLQGYLGSIHKGMAMSDERAQEKLAAEAAEALDQLQETKALLDDEGRKEVSLLKTAIDELKLQAALGKMESTEALEDLQERIDQGYRRVKKSLGKLEEKTEEEVGKLEDRLQKSWRALQLEVMMLYIRLDVAQEAGVKKISDATHEVVSDVKLISQLVADEAEHLADDFSAWVKKTKKSVSAASHRLLEDFEKRFKD